MNQDSLLYFVTCKQLSRSFAYFVNYIMKLIVMKDKNSSVDETANVNVMCNDSLVPIGQIVAEPSNCI